MDEKRWMTINEWRETNDEIWRDFDDIQQDLSRNDKEWQEMTGNDKIWQEMTRLDSK